MRYIYVLLMMLVSINQIHTSSSHNNKSIFKSIYIKNTDDFILNYIKSDLDDNPISDNFYCFMYAMGEKETRNNYTLVHKNGNYLGRYQIGKSVRKHIKINKTFTLLDLSDSAFIHTPYVQDWCMYKLVSANYLILYKHFVKYDISWDKPKVNELAKDNAIATISGYLAAANLVGAKAVKKYLDDGIITYDGNNKPLTDYFQLNNMKFDLDIPKNKIIK